MVVTRWHFKVDTAWLRKTATAHTKKEQTTMRYEYFQHMTSGEIFAVALDDKETVTASIGPLVRRELADSADAYSHNMSDEDNDWFAETENDWRILSAIDAMQKRQYAEQDAAQDAANEDADRAR